jgi:FkbM family methyltransferase
MPPNRFDAMEAALASLAARGFRPAVVIDAGANVGAWTRTALSIFPDAQYHLIEPQPPLQAPLERLRRDHPNIHLYPVALTRTGSGPASMVGVGTTGARIAPVSEAATPGAVRVTTATLDSLLADRVTRASRALLKLDLEGSEIEALAGASALLASVEVVVTEVHFYDVERTGHPTFLETLRFLDAHRFQLTDIVALASRPRDGRLRMGDVAFARDDSPLVSDGSWE